MVTAERFRALCLALPGTREVPHLERAAFRTTRRIFATLPPDGLTANLLLVPELQAAVIDENPRAFRPVPGGWGRMGYTTVDLKVVSEADLDRVLRLAHALASEPPRKKRAPRPKAPPARRRSR